jgi:hypothetical protein
VSIRLVGRDSRYHDTEKVLNITSKDSPTKSSIVLNNVETHDVGGQRAQLNVKLWALEYSHHRCSKRSLWLGFGAGFIHGGVWFADRIEIVFGNLGWLFGALRHVECME